MQVKIHCTLHVGIPDNAEEAEDAYGKPVTPRECAILESRYVGALHEHGVDCEIRFTDFGEVPDSWEG